MRSHRLESRRLAERSKIRIVQQGISPVPGSGRHPQGAGFLSMEQLLMKATLVDLFCGAGGLACGFSRAGFKTIHAMDSWEPAVQTYLRNLGDHVEQASITEQTELPNATVIAGGPPCQGFSSAGRRRDGDERNSSVAVFAGLIASYRPVAFVFENVEGFLTNAEGQFVIDLLEPILEAGYHVHLQKINAANSFSIRCH